MTLNITPLPDPATFFRMPGMSAKEQLIFDAPWSCLPPLRHAPPLAYPGNFTAEEWEFYLRADSLDQRLATELATPLNHTARASPIFETCELNDNSSLRLIAPQPDHNLGKLIDPRTHRLVYLDGSVEDKPRWWQLGNLFWHPVIIARPGQHIAATAAALKLAALHGPTLWVGECRNPEVWRQWAHRRGLPPVREWNE